MVRQASFFCYPHEYKRFSSDLAQESLYSRTVVCYELVQPLSWKDTSRRVSQSIRLCWHNLRNRLRRWKKCYYHRGVRYLLTLQGSMVVGSKIVASHVIDFALCDNYLYLLSRGGIQRYRCGAIWDTAYLDYRPCAALRAFQVRRGPKCEHIVQVYW